MKVVINALNAKKNGGGGKQIASNFMLHSRADDSIDWYYFVSTDLDDEIGTLFDSIRDCRYFVFPTQPSLKTHFKVQRTMDKLITQIHPDLVYSILAPSYFEFKVREVSRFANAWVTCPTEEALMSLSIVGRLRKKFLTLAQVYFIKRSRFFI